MLQNLQTKKTYLYQQYRSEKALLSFFNALDDYKQITYNSVKYQEFFYNLSPYSYYFLQCIFGFDYNIISSNVNQKYYDSGVTYDSKETYDQQVSPIKTRFFTERLYRRKKNGNRIFTICDFCMIIKDTCKIHYNDIKIDILTPRSQNNLTNQVKYQFTVYNVNNTLFNLLISYLIYNKKHLPINFNYILICGVKHG